jgi:hypothetical protein
MEHRQCGFWPGTSISLVSIASTVYSLTIFHLVYIGETRAEDTALRGRNRSADSAAGIPEGESSVQLALLAAGILARRR